MKAGWDRIRKDGAKGWRYCNPVRGRINGEIEERIRRLTWIALATRILRDVGYLVEDNERDQINHQASLV